MGPFSSVLVASFAVMFAVTMVVQSSEQFLSRLSGVWSFVLLVVPFALPIIGACVLIALAFLVGMWRSGRPTPFD